MPPFTLFRVKDTSFSSVPCSRLLNADELKSLLGHELAHYHLWDAKTASFTSSIG